jgi:hypothetical protein
MPVLMQVQLVSRVWSEPPPPPPPHIHTHVSLRRTCIEKRIPETVLQVQLVSRVWTELHEVSRAVWMLFARGQIGVSFTVSKSLSLSLCAFSVSRNLSGRAHTGHRERERE